jgi:hypothetical protein
MARADLDVRGRAPGFALQSQDHGALLIIGELPVLQQPAVHDLDGCHALKHAGNHHHSGELSVVEFDLEFVPNFHAINAATVDIGGVIEVVVARDDVDGPVIADMGPGRGWEQRQQYQAEDKGSYAHKLWIAPAGDKTAVRYLGY